jgi:hypothetical protein
MKNNLDKIGEQSARGTAANASGTSERIKKDSRDD